MDNDTRDFILEIATILDDSGIGIALKESGKGAAVCALICLAGGLLFGAKGLAAGGALGGAAAYTMTRGNYKSIREVLHDMTDSQQEVLVRNVKQAIGKVNSKDNVLLINQSAQVQTVVRSTVLAFVKSVLGLRVCEIEN